MHVGLRPDGVFLGERDHTAIRCPNLSARGLRTGRTDGGAAGSQRSHARRRRRPGVEAAATAFGFVYVHPFQDGNGDCTGVWSIMSWRNGNSRRQEWSSRSPRSCRPHRRISQDVADPLRPLMNFIEWRPTPQHNVEVLNDTADLYGISIVRKQRNSSMLASSAPSKTICRAKSTICAATTKRSAGSWTP